MANDVVPVRDRPVALPAGGSVRPIVAASFEEAYRISQAMGAAGLLPESVNTPDLALMVIMAGAEAGLPPMASIQSIMIVNKRPSIWGDGALALVRASGLCEFVRETWDAATETATCTMKRKGDPEPVERTFSHADAITAGLMGKDTWKKYLRRMCQMRARSWTMRDGFADVLKGLHIVEEARDIPEAKPAQDRIAPPAPSLDDPPSPEEEERVAAVLSGDATATVIMDGEKIVDVKVEKATAEPVQDDGPPPAPVDEEEAQIVDGKVCEVADDAEPFDQEAFCEKAAERMQAADGSESIDDIWLNEIEPFIGKISPPDVAWLEKVKQSEEKRRAP